MSRPTRGCRWPVPALLLAGLCGCASFERSLVEFDSVTRHDQSLEEPDQIRYRVRPYSYSTFNTMLDWISSWLVDSVGTVPPIAERSVEQPVRTARPTESEAPADTGGTVQNPALIAREWLDCLVAKSAGNRHKTALAANRLLWVLSCDVYPQTVLTGIRSVEAMIRRSGRDPMRVPPPLTRDVGEGDRLRGQMAELEQLDQARRGSGTLTAEQRARYMELLAGLTKAPLVQRKAQRNLLRVLADAELAEPDPELRRKTAEAADQAFDFALVTGLRDMLTSTVTPVAREEALLAFYRLSGPGVVPVLIGWMTNPQGKRPEDRYDPDAGVRRTLVRLCGQVPAHLALPDSDSGTTPVPRLLYETISADQPSLQLLAQEALAQLLGRPAYFDPVTLDDREWAHEWWRNVVSTR